MRGHYRAGRFRAVAGYVAGSRLEDALEVARRLIGEGKAVSIDLIGQAAATADAYVEVADSLSTLGGDAYLSIDLSQVGLDISADYCRGQVERVLQHLPAGSRLQVGAEESERSESVLSVVLALARDGAPVMATLQANLRRSPAHAVRLGELRVPVRLVKGSFVEPSRVALPWGEETDRAYLELARELDAAGCELALATHDARIRERLLDAIDGASCELLLGVRPEDADELVRRGRRTRIYVPFGEDSERYVERRLAEARR
jgi:proline dehydrogenase